MTRTWSIRRQLTRYVLGLVLLAWAATVLIATFAIRYEMNEILDEELRTVAEATALFLEDAEGPPNPRVIGLTDASGNRVLRVTRTGQSTADAPWPVLETDGLHNTAGWRVLRLTAGGGVVEVGHNLSWRLEELWEAASSMLVMILPMIALLIWGLRRSLAQALAPLERLAATIVARKPEDLSPVPLDDLSQETLPLIAGMNAYIARIETLRLAERQFIANAAHELRTPIASIYARLELSSDPDAKIAVPQLKSLTHRLGRLLQLSRSEAGLGLGAGPSDLVQILRLVIEEVGRNTDRPIHFDDGDHEQMIVPHDPDALAILLRNLLENAVEHGTGTVRIRLGPGAQLRVENPTDNPGFLEEPFRKGAQSGGTGLGLSIVSALVNVMGVEVDKQIFGGQAVVTVTFADRAQ
ncbi:sensor histidine kinase [Pseudorhodobacter aquimaris]|uniref:sensor histidine kinase n=1 Tax=Pseudorhodobacter aquimaris TaxID=687412 RepID=UPI00067C70EB|nr:ATP-binding protein [Pseudorhodobacter aquimaris]